MTTALFIGRFQPFHCGHYNAVNSALDEYDTVIIGIGSAQHSHIPSNPLTLAERQHIIANCFPDVETIGIDDCDDDADWIAWILDNIDFDTGISGNDHVRRIFRNNDLPIEHPDYRDPEYYSGTAIRDLATDEKQWKDRVPDCSQDMLEEIGFEERVRQSQ